MTTPPPCQPCTTARQYPGHNHFSPACLYCGARILQHLGTLAIPPSECRNRRRNELAIWMAHGHSEAQLRELAKSDMPALAPESGPAAPAASAHPSKAKRR